MRIKSSREKRILTVKTSIRWMLYVLLILFCYGTMNAGTFLRPVLLIPAAICIASYTGEIQAAGLGAFCGFLIDIGCGKLLGFNAVILCFFCVAVSLFHTHLLRNRLINILAATIISAYILSYLDYKFYYEIWKYENVNLIYKNYTVPVFRMTVVSTFFVYGIVALINKFLIPKQHFTIEETIRKMNAEANNQ